MAIKGSVKEKKQFDSKPDYGFAEMEIVSINPDKEELIELLGVDEDRQEDFKSPIYSGEKDGVDTIRLDFWMKAVKTEKLYKKSIFLENRVRTNKDETKSQFINNFGFTTWATDEDAIPTWFSKAGNVRKALVGEEQLYNLLTKWLDIDFKEEGAELYIDPKKLFKENYRELREQIGGDLASIFIALADVKVVEKDGEVKHYQNIYDNFLPGYMMKVIRNSKYTPEKIAALRAKNGQPDSSGKKIYAKGLDAFVLQLTDPEYGNKNEYILGELTQFDESTSFVSSNKVLDTVDASSADY